MTRFVKLVLIPVVALTVLAAAVIGVVALTKGEPEEPKLGAGAGKPGTGLSTVKDSSPDVLAPKSTLKVGSERYVSVCRLLPVRKIEEIFGNLPPGAEAYEEYYETSVPDPRNESYGGARTSCEVYGSPWYLSMSLEQRVEPYSDAREIISELPYEKSDVEKMMTAYRKADLAERPEARELLAQMEESFTAYQTGGTGLSVDDLPTLVLPEYEDYSEETRKFTLVEGTRKVTLTYDNDDVAMDDGEFLSKAAVALATIRTNLADPALSQSPAPTYTQEPTIGSTKIVEPCAVLDHAAFQAPFGMAPNGEVSRDLLPADYSAYRARNRDAVDTVRNGCTRRFEARTLGEGHKPTRFEKRFGDEGSIRYRVSINHGETEAEAKDYFKILSEGRGAKAIETDADQTVLVRDDDYSTVYARSGPYVLTVRISVDTYSRSSGYKSVAVTAPQYRKAVNKLAANLAKQA